MAPVDCSTTLPCRGPLRVNTTASTATAGRRPVTRRSSTVNVLPLSLPRRSRRTPGCGLTDRRPQAALLAGTTQLRRPDALATDSWRRCRPAARIDGAALRYQTSTFDTPYLRLPYAVGWRPILLQSAPLYLAADRPVSSQAPHDAGDHELAGRAACNPTPSEPRRTFVDSRAHGTASCRRAFALLQRITLLGRDGQR